MTKPSYAAPPAPRLIALIGNALKLGTAEADRRNEYLAWLGDSLLAPRLTVDPELGESIAETLRSTLLAPLLKNDYLRDEGYRRAADLVLGDFIDQLPRSIASVLWDDQSLAEALGRRLQRAVTVGSLRLPYPEVWQGAVRTLTEGHAHLNTLDGAECSVKAVRDEGMPLAFEFQAGDEKVRVAEPFNGLLSPSIEERTVALRACRAWFDGNDRDFERQLAEIVTLDDPARRMDSVLALRDKSTTVHYECLRKRLAQEKQMRWPDLEAPSTASLMGHLRLSPEAIVSGFSVALSAAAEALVAEEGLIAALERLTALPTPLPLPIREGLGRLAEDQRHSLLRAFSRTCVSPIRRCHVIRLLLEHPEDPALPASGRAHLEALVEEAPDNCRAFWGVLAIAEEGLASRPGFTKLPTALQLALGWTHADALYSVLRQMGTLDEWIANLRERSETAPVDVFLRPEETWRDIAGHRQLTAEPLLLFGLGFAAETAPGSVLTAAVRQRLVDRVTKEVDDSGTRVPVAALLRDRELGPNAMGSFLHWRPSLEHLVGPVVAESVRPETLKSLLKDRAECLVEDPQNIGAWLFLCHILGHFSPTDYVSQRLVAASEKVDLTRPLAGAADAWQIRPILLFLCAQHTFRSPGSALSDPTPQVMAVARAVNEASSRLGEKVVEEWAGALLEACAWTRLVEAKPEQSARGFAELLREVVLACPPLAERTRRVVQHLADRLPIDQGKHLWYLLTFLRTF